MKALARPSAISLVALSQLFGQGELIRPGPPAPEQVLPAAQALAPAHRTINCPIQTKPNSHPDTADHTRAFQAGAGYMFALPCPPLSITAETVWSDTTHSVSVNGLTNIQSASPTASSACTGHNPAAQPVRADAWLANALRITDSGKSLINPEIIHW